MPRKTQEEIIADLEAKLAEAKAKASTRVDEQIAKIKERIDALLVRKEKIEDQIKTLQIEAEELAGSKQEAEQPELPVTDPDVELHDIKAPVTAGKGSGRGKPDAA